LSTIGAVCAILTTVLFFTGGVLLSTSGVQDLIPPTGTEGLDWIADVDDASGAFFAGGWVIVAVTIVGSVALVGFYDVLQTMTSPKTPRIGASSVHSPASLTRRQAG
jgi:hypothetical protein